MLLLIWLLVLGISYLLFGLDDIFIDLIALTHRLGPRPISHRLWERIQKKPEQRIAVMVASWKESGVLRRMVTGNRDRLSYGNYHFFLGVYPNDLETLAEAQALAQEFSDVHVVLNTRLGPTSKGQMINEIVRGVLAAEASTSSRYDGLLIHDSEDVMHPRSLRLFNWLLGRYDFIQIPVFSLPVRKSSWVAGTYLDEFSESHTKDLLVRDRMGAPIPSAGTGTLVSRALVASLLARQAGSFMNQSSLTEDYELGLNAPEGGFRPKFACFYLRGADGKRDFVATRAFFPKAFFRSVKQKTRWTVGIAFQGLEHLGWRRDLLQSYFLYRDRKGPLCNVLVLCGMITALFLPWAHGGWERASHTYNVPGLLLSFIATANLCCMLIRIGHRIRCTTLVYGPALGFLAIARLPISNLINASAAIRATWQYLRHRFGGIELIWSKTDHELPEGFGDLVLKDR